MNRHKISPENNIEFWELFILCCKHRLSTRVTKYILWKYACNESYRRIVKLDGNNVSFQSVEQMVYRAHKKIKYHTLKNNNHDIYYL